MLAVGQVALLMDISSSNVHCQKKKILFSVTEKYTESRVIAVSSKHQLRPVATKQTARNWKISILYNVIFIISQYLATATIWALSANYLKACL